MLFFFSMILILALGAFIVQILCYASYKNSANSFSQHSRLKTS